MSRLSARASAQTVGPSSSRATARTASKSPGDAERSKHFEQPLDAILSARDLENDGGRREIDDARPEGLADAKHLVALVIGCEDLDERQLVDHRGHVADVVDAEHVHQLEEAR